MLRVGIGLGPRSLRLVITPMGSYLLSSCSDLQALIWVYKQLGYTDGNVTLGYPTEEEVRHLRSRLGVSTFDASSSAYLPS